MTVLSELTACGFNPIGMFRRETVELYWENYQIQRMRTDLLNLWMNQ